MFKTAYMCASCFYWETLVEGSTGNTYHVHWGRNEDKGGYAWHCTCKGFHYRGECRHIKEIEQNESRCAWNESANPNLKCPVDKNGKATCPKCGGVARSYKIMTQKRKK